MTIRAAPRKNILRDYLSLSKPRIILLLTFTALAGMFLASGGPPDPLLAIVVVGAGAMASAGANALNHFLDRDIDSLMRRTMGRPVAALRIRPRDALVFGLVTNGVAFTLFFTLVNPLSAALTLSATLFYVFVYTIGLKRVSPQNIVIGGAAGALPPVIGWTAVTGSLGLPAVYMFAIVFFWTPPHFWALSLLLKDDYRKAGVPMLPVVAGVAETKRNIFLYTLLLLALTPLFFVHPGRGVALPWRFGDARTGVRVFRDSPPQAARHRRGRRGISLLTRLPRPALHCDSGRRVNQLESRPPVTGRQRTRKGPPCDRHLRIGLLLSPLRRS